MYLIVFKFWDQSPISELNRTGNYHERIRELDFPALDAVSNNNGVLAGSVTYTPGYSGNAFNFNGGGSVSVADSSSLHLSAFSLSTWFAWDLQGGTAAQFLTGKAAGHFELAAGFTGTNSLRFTPAGAATTVDAANAIQPGWNHVAATWDGSTATLYVNNASVGSKSVGSGADNLATDTSPLIFGKRGDGTYPLNGLLDEVTLFDRALIAAEVEAIYQGSRASITLATPTAGNTTATLNGAVNDDGAATTVGFESGTSAGYGSTAVATPAAIAAGSGVTPVSASLTSLSCGTEYHYRIDAQNSFATTYGPDQVFATSACQSQSIGAITFTPATLSLGSTTVASATATSGLAVTFSTLTPSVCSVTSATVATLASGTCTIAANQAGNATCARHSGNRQPHNTGIAVDPGADHQQSGPGRSHRGFSGLHTHGERGELRLRGGGTVERFGAAHDNGKHHAIDGRDHGCRHRFGGHRGCDGREPGSGRRRVGGLQLRYRRHYQRQCFRLCLLVGTLP